MLCSCFASDFFQARSIDWPCGLVTVGLGTGVVCAFWFLWGLGMAIQQFPNGFQTHPEWFDLRFILVPRPHKNRNTQTTPVPRPTVTRPCGLLMDRACKKSLAKQERNTNLQGKFKVLSMYLLDTCKMLTLPVR